MPAAPAAAGCQDIDGHWAEQSINFLIAQEIVKGYPDNTFKPENPISRAEFMVMTNKAFGFTATTTINYSDVKASDWFAPEIARAKAAGYISGYEDGTMRPNQQISRQEAASIISRILALTPANTEAALKQFSDSNTFANWSKQAIAAMVEKGYLKGYPDKTFKPANSIKRAEAAVILKAVYGQKLETPEEEKPAETEIPTQYNEPGTFGPETGTQTIDDHVTISASGVILNNTIITGNLTIDKAVADGDVQLNNIEVQGTTYINGGGENSITLNQCQLNQVIVNKKDGKIRIVLSKDSSIKTLTADSGLKLQGQGTITNLTINSSGVEIQPQPVNKPTIKSGITAQVSGVTISGTSSSGGGGGDSSPVITTANVSNATELTSALSNSNITTITLTGNISASPTITRSLTINFGAYTLTGDLTFQHNGAGISVLTGSAGNRIIGNLTVNTPNASFNNGVTVSGTVTITDVAPASWTESATGNTLTITDPNGATITVTGSPDAVTVTQDAATGTLTLTVNPGATVTNITTNAPINIQVAAGATVTDIVAQSGATNSTITNNGTITTLIANTNINLEANVAPTTTATGGGAVITTTGTSAAAVTPIPVVNVTAITVTGAGGATTVVNGSTLQMTATATPEDATNKKVSWTVNNGTGSATINAAGLLKATGMGTVTVKATANDGSGVTGQLVVTISGQEAAFTPGAGGSLPAFTPFTAEPNKIGGLYVDKNHKYYPFIFGGSPSYYHYVELRFPSPASISATGYKLQYSADAETWANYQTWDTDAGANVDLVTGSADQDNFIVSNPIGNYSYRLMVVGGEKDGWVSNTVAADIPTVNSRFISWSLDESFTISGVMFPFVGRGLEASFTAKVADYGNPEPEYTNEHMTFQWYRVNPLTYEMTPIAGATGLTYITTEADLGYKLLIRATGDETNIGGYAQIFSNGSTVMPNDANITNVSADGFTLNLYKSVDGLGPSDLTLTDYNGDPVTITSVTPGDSAGIYNIAASLNLANGPFNLNNNSDFWKITSQMPGGHQQHEGVQVPSH